MKQQYRAAVLNHGQSAAVALYTYAKLVKGHSSTPVQSSAVQCLQTPYINMHVCRYTLYLQVQYTGYTELLLIHTEWHNPTHDSII